MLLVALALSLLLFRVFDITKPLGIKWLDEHPLLTNPFGVIFDDVVAGVYSFIILWLIIYLMPIFH